MRRIGEAAAWLLLVVVLWGSDLLAKLGEQATGGIAKDAFTLISEQVTSAMAVLLMIPFLLHWLRQFPLRLGEWPRVIIGHTLGSIIFAFGHYALMVSFRAIWYSLQGRDFIWREPFVANLVVEYQKDIKIYIDSSLSLLRIDTSCAIAIPGLRQQLTDWPCKREQATPCCASSRSIISKPRETTCRYSAAIVST